MIPVKGEPEAIRWFYATDSYVTRHLNMKRLKIETFAKYAFELSDGSRSDRIYSVEIYYPSPEMQRQGCLGCHKVENRCDSCHTSHDTSLKIARNPAVCGKCHMGPDHSQYEMWKSSLHGVLFAEKGRDYAHWYGNAPLKLTLLQIGSRAEVLKNVDRLRQRIHNLSLGKTVNNKNKSTSPADDLKGELQNLKDRYPKGDLNEMEYSFLKRKSCLKGTDCESLISCNDYHID